MSPSAPQPSATNDVDVVHLTLRIDELAAGLAQLASDVEDLNVALLPSDLAPSDLDSISSPSRAPSPESDAASEPAYTRLDDWVEQYFLPTFRRPIGGELRWCAQWQEHAEAITRLEALWRSWETLRLDPNLGIATWLTNYLDPLLAVLLSRSGPFAQCTPDRHM